MIFRRKGVRFEIIDMTWNLPLLLSAAAFALFFFWKFRPVFGGNAGREVTRALTEAQKRIDSAVDAHARAEALCDAGDACLMTRRKRDSAIGYYLRAMRTSPESTDVVSRASKAFVRKPRALESLLWRRLSAEAWTGPAKTASEAALRHLAALYAGPLRRKSRARAIKHVLDVLQTKH